MGLGVGIILRHVFTLLSARRQIPELLKSGAQIVDVRLPNEFAAGHASGAETFHSPILGEKRRIWTPTDGSLSAARHLAHQSR